MTTFSHKLPRLTDGLLSLKCEARVCNAKQPHYAARSRGHTLIQFDYDDSYEVVADHEELPFTTRRCWSRVCRVDAQQQERLLR